MDTHWRNIWNSVLSGVIAGIILIIIPKESIIQIIGGKNQLTVLGILLIGLIFYIISKNR